MRLTDRRRVPVASRLTLSHRFRFLTCALAAGTIIVLVIVQTSMIAGLKQTATWAGHTGADLWVVPAHDSPYKRFDFLPAGTADRLQAMAGQKVASTLITEWGGLPNGDHLIFANVVAGDWQRLHLDVSSGRVPQAAGEVVISDAYAASRKIRVGDAIQFLVGHNQQGVKVVGLAPNATVLQWQYVFTVPETLMAIAHDPQWTTPTAAAVHLDHQGDAKAAATALRRQLPEVDVLTPSQFRAAVLDRTVGPFLPVVNALVLMSAVTGCIILALTMAILASESERDLAVLATLGTTKRRLRRIVFTQIGLVLAVAAVAGSVFGTLLTFGLGLVMPLLPTSLRPETYLVAIVAALAMGAIGCQPPLRRLRHLDPKTLLCR